MPGPLSSPQGTWMSSLRVDVMRLTQCPGCLALGAGWWGWGRAAGSLTSAGPVSCSGHWRWDTGAWPAMYDIIPNPSHGLCPAARCSVLLSTARGGGWGVGSASGWSQGHVSGPFFVFPGPIRTTPYSPSAPGGCCPDLLHCSHCPGLEESGGGAVWVPMGRGGCRG